MRAASTYRGARRNAIRPIWDGGHQIIIKPREPWVPGLPVQSRSDRQKRVQPQVKERHYVYTGKRYSAGWRSENERRERRLEVGGLAA